MAPSRRKGSQRAAAAAAARRQWKVGDLVLAKMKGFPAWPAMVSEPEKWGYSSSDRKKLLVYFYGTKQIAFCNYADIEAFTEEKKKSLLIKRQGKGADFVRAVDEIIDIYETMKQQKFAEANSGDEGVESNAGNSEGSRSKSSRRSPEISSHITNNDQSEAQHAPTESHDVLISDGMPEISLAGDRQNTNAVTTDPAESVSILDELRQTPLSGTTTRKRLRDGSLQSSVIQRVPSLRRSRSSSGGDPCKFQKSTILPSDADLASNSLVHDLLEEEPERKNKLTEVVAHIPLSCNEVSTCSDNLAFNGCGENKMSDVPTMKSDEEDGMLESYCKFENSVKRENSVEQHLDKNLEINGSERLNDKVDPIKTVILKKKRNPNRKRVINTRECEKLDKEADLNVELNERPSESPNSHIETNGNFSKADGDEHLPLVKRARVRMGKPPAEETQLEDFSGNRGKSQIEAPIDNFDKNATSSTTVNSSPAFRTLSIKEGADSLPINDCTLNSGRDPVFWKVNKYQSKGTTLDVEAALPPSKRLHRALEAMSANAAEATFDASEASGDLKLVSNGCTNSPKTNLVNLLAEANVPSSEKSPFIQSFDCTLLQKSTSGLSSSLTSHNLEVPVLTSSKVEPDDSLPKSLSSPHGKDCKEMLIDATDRSGSFTSEIADTDSHEKVLRPFAFSSIKKQVDSASKEGLLCQFSSPRSDDDGKKTLKLPKECSSQGDIAEENGIVKPVTQRLESKPVTPRLESLLNLKEGSDLLSTDSETAVVSFATNVGAEASKTSGSTKSPGSLSDESMLTECMQKVPNEVEDKAAKYCDVSCDTTPMKDLIAAAQARRLLSRSASFPDHIVDGKIILDPVVSPSVANREDSSMRGSSPNAVAFHRPASDDRTHCLQNGSRSPSVGQREKGLNKLTFHGEANVARRSFAALLCMLSRTKESIGRATRVAIDCAKYGIAPEAIEILLQHLERESSLHKRIDLFFLVDSITQCSRSQKGGVGDVYLSLVQSMLPRLLSAAAPPGNAAWENRKQCLKVLRLWLERRTLPESVVRHHIRELESVSETSLTSSYSRRPPRTERAINDPIREMEGMFVDEYGSNTSFQLQHFLHSRVLEDDEGSGDDEKSFEAVTPEWNNEVDDEKVTAQNSIEKHRRILEDVDGELEMEDVAPHCGVEVSSTSHVAGAGAVSSAHYQSEKHQLLPCGPPLPEELPPSPPPLPSSPPPMALPFPTHSLAAQKQLAGSHAHPDVSDFQTSSVANNIQNQQHSVQQSNNLHCNMVSSEPVPYYTHGYGGLPQKMPPPLLCHSSSGSYGSHPAVGNNVQPAISAPLPNKPLPSTAYCLQPPPPTVSNQFSYVQAESQQRSRPWCSSSFSDRLQYVHDSQGGNYFGDRGTRGPIRHENTERGRFSPAVNTGPVLSEKAEALPNPVPLYGPSLDPSPNPCHGWSFPPRSSSYSVSASRPPLDTPISRTTGASGYWRPK